MKRILTVLSLTFALSAFAFSQAPSQLRSKIEAACGMSCCCPGGSCCGNHCPMHCCDPSN